MRRSVTLSFMLAALACGACGKSSTAPGGGPVLTWDKASYPLAVTTSTVTATALLRVTPGAAPLPSTIGVNLTGYKATLVTDSDHGTGTVTFQVQFVATPSAAKGEFGETATLTIGTASYTSSTTIVVE